MTYPLESSLRLGKNLRVRHLKSRRNQTFIRQVMWKSKWPHEDLNELIDALLPFAQQMLAKHGDFFHSALARLTMAQSLISLVGRGEEQPPSQQVVDVMVGGLRSQAERQEICAAGICLDVRIIPPGRMEKTDAIVVRLEHANGEAIHVFLPYRKAAHGAWEYEDLFATRGEHKIFQPPNDVA